MIVVCFGATRNFERAKKRNDWLWTGNRHILYRRVLFKLTFRSRLELGFCETCAESSSKTSSSAISRVDWKGYSGDGWGGENRRNFQLSRAAGHFPANAALVFRPEGLVYNWKQSMSKHVQQSFSGSASRGQPMSAFIRTLSRQVKLRLG